METKYADNHGWDFGVTSLAAPVAYGDSQMKTASESFEYATNLPPQRGRTPIVVIAMGATESYGPNRNADGFSRGMLRQYHPTFEQFGHVFVNHKNKDPRGSVGDILNSFYNREMDRVELVLSLDNDKASRFVDRIHRGLAIPVSMGLHIPHDVCNVCGHQAPTVKHWCQHMDRKGIFGPNSIYYVDQDPARAFPGKDGVLIFVHNPSGKFFDISIVTRPADMTAYMIYGPGAIGNGAKLAAYEAALVDAGYSVQYIDYQMKMATMAHYDENTLTPLGEHDGTDPQAGPVIRDVEGPRKLADMIKRVEGLAGGLDAFTQDGEFLPTAKAATLTRHGVEKLAHLLEATGTKASFPEVFKLTHMALHGTIPSRHELKQASAYQSEFLEFSLNNPAVEVFTKNAFGLDASGDPRNINFIRRNDWGSQSKLEGADYSSTTKKEAAACGLVAASIFLGQEPSTELLCRGRAIAGEIPKRDLNTKRAELAIYEDPAALFQETSKTFGEVIF